MSITDLKAIEGESSARGLRFAIVLARFNGFIGERLLEGAVDTLVQHGATLSDIELVRVPGAFELPLALKALAAKGKYDAMVALGAVIRGETPHFDFVAGECAKGISEVMMQFDIPVAFGVLTVDSVQQAVERAGGKSGNKGADAALSAIEMASLLRRLCG